MSRLSAFSLIVATYSAVTALRPTPALVQKVPLHGQRTSNLLAQNSWTTAVDENGAQFYYNAQSGQSQWEPPQVVAQQGHGALWRAVPTTGVHSEYAVRSGEELILGRFDMLDQSLYVSRQQCIIQVAAHGTATLISTGKAPTLYRQYSGAPWYVLRRSRPLGDDIGYDGTHDLSDGEQICLDIGNPECAIFTLFCQDEGNGVGGYDAQNSARHVYSDDGNWMWNGSEWIAASRTSERVRLYEAEDELTC